MNKRFLLLRQGSSNGAFAKRLMAGVLTFAMTCSLAYPRAIHEALAAGDEVPVSTESLADNTTGTTQNDGPGALDPSGTDPGTTDPGTTDPEAADPETTDPETTDPDNTDPGTMDPGTTEPGTTDPGGTDPGYGEPGATEPGTTEPSANENTANETNNDERENATRGTSGVSTPQLRGANNREGESAVPDNAEPQEGGGEDPAAPSTAVFSTRPQVDEGTGATVGTDILMEVSNGNQSISQGTLTLSYIDQDFDQNEGSQKTVLISSTDILQDGSQSTTLVFSLPYNDPNIPVGIYTGVVGAEVIANEETVQLTLGDGASFVDAGNDCVFVVERLDREGDNLPSSKPIIDKAELDGTSIEACDPNRPMKCTNLCVVVKDVALNTRDSYVKVAIADQESAPSLFAAVSDQSTNLFYTAELGFADLDISDGTCTITIYAVDIAGNETTKTYTIVVDNVPPAVEGDLCLADTNEALAGKNYYAVQDDSETVTLCFKATESLNLDPDKTFAMIGENPTGIDAHDAENHLYSFNAHVVDGPVAITLVLTDELGNSNVEALSIDNIVFDNKNPVVTGFYASDQQLEADSAAEQFLQYVTQDAGPVTVKATIAETNLDVDETSISIKQDGSSIEPASVEWDSQGSIHTATIAGFKDGAKYLVTITPKDLSGRTGQSSSVHFVVDLTDPEGEFAIVGTQSYLDSASGKEYGVYKQGQLKSVTYKLKEATSFNKDKILFTDSVDASQGTSALGSWEEREDQLHVFKFNTNSLIKEGLHTIEVSGADDSGRPLESESISYLYDATAPHITHVELQNAAELKIFDDDASKILFVKPGENEDRVYLVMSATDDNGENTKVSGLQSVNVVASGSDYMPTDVAFKDGTYVIGLKESDNEEASRKVDFTSEIQVVVSDRAGNERKYDMRYDVSTEKIIAHDEADVVGPQGTALRLIQDRTEPDLGIGVWVDGTLAQDANSKYYKGDVRVGATFVDHNADLIKRFGKTDNATLTIYRSNYPGGDKEQYRQLSLNSFTKDAMGLDGDMIGKQESLKYFARTNDQLEDGHYRLEATATDLADNTAGARLDEFTVDNTPPELVSVVWKSVDKASAEPVESVTGENGITTEYFDAARSVEVTVREHNFYLHDGENEGNPCVAFNITGLGAQDASEAEWRAVDGEPDTYRITYTFANEGLCSFSLTGQDQAGNKLVAMDSQALVVADGGYSVNPFIIDKTGPEVIGTKVGILTNDKLELHSLNDNECIGTEAIVRAYVRDANFKPSASLFQAVVDQSKEEKSYSTNEWKYDSKDKSYYAELECKVDGSYHFTVTANDHCPAHEQVVQQGTLRIDLENPMVNVSYEAVDEDGEARGVILGNEHLVNYYDGAVRETITIADRNLTLEKTSITLSGGRQHSLADLCSLAEWGEEERVENEITYELFEQSPRDSEGIIVYTLKVTYNETPSKEGGQALFERVRPTIAVCDDANHEEMHRESVFSDYRYVVDQSAPNLASSSIDADPSPRSGYSEDDSNAETGKRYFFNAKDSTRIALEFTDNHEIASISLDDGDDKVYVSELNENATGSGTTSIKKDSFGFEATINNARTSKEPLAKASISFDLLDGATQKQKDKNTELERNFTLTVTDRAGNYHKWTIEKGVVYDRHTGTMSEDKAADSRIATPGGNIASPFALIRDTTKPKIMLTLLDAQGNAVDLSEARVEERRIYFNAPKILQVDIDEYNFNYMKVFRPDVTVATVYFNTALDPSRQTGEAAILMVGGKDAVGNDYFQQTNAGDRSAWRASYPFSVDGDYSVTAGFKDIAQNDSGAFTLPTDQNRGAAEVTIDGKAPTFSVVWNDDVVPVEGGTKKTTDKAVYYDAHRTATITVTEHNFDSQRMIPHVVLDGADVTSQVYSSKNWKHVANSDIYTLEIPFAQDGDYTFTFEGEDRAGNKAVYDADNSSKKNNSDTKQGSTKYSAIPFSIDTTAPVLTVTYQNNDPNVFKKMPYYKDKRTVTISIEERYWNQNMISIVTSGKKVSDSNWRSKSNNHQTKKSNTTHTITYEFDEGDNHELVISGCDKALNQLAFNKDMGTAVVGGITTGGFFSDHTYRAQRFTVDKTAPVIFVTFDENSPTEVDGMQYYAAKRLATVHVVEHCWDNSYFKITTKGGRVLQSVKEEGFATNDGKWYSKDDDHIAKVLFDEGDELQLTVVGRDLAINAAQYDPSNSKNTRAKFNGVAYDPHDALGRTGYQSKKFYVDLTDPVINVRFDNNKGIADTVDNESDAKLYYKSKKGRTATITVTEHNFKRKEGSNFFDVKVKQGRTDVGSQYWISEPKTSGDVTTYTVRFPEDGDYTLTVVGKDLAYRKATYDVNDKNNSPARTNGVAYRPEGKDVAGYRSHQFTIDHTIPEVLVEAVDKGQDFNHDAKTNRPYYDDEHDIRVTIKDRNLVRGTAAVKINGIVYSDIAWQRQSVDSNSVDIGTWSTAKAEDAVVTYTAVIGYKETPNDRDCFYTPSVSVVDKAGNENMAFRFGTETEFVNDFTAPTIDKVTTDQLPTSDYEKQFQFYNVPTALRFEMSDSHDLQMAAMADKDNEYNFDAVINTDNDRYTDRNAGYLIFSLKDGVQSGNNTEFDNQATFSVSDVAGNMRTWTVDPYGTVLEESVSKAPREAANKDLRDEGVYPTKLIQDETRPIITLSPMDIQGGYYNSPQTVHVAVNEFNFAYLQQFDPSRVIFTVHKQDGSAGRAETSWDRVASDFSGSASDWEYDQTFADDGHYTVTAQFKDYANNESEERTISEFTIDRTNPQVTVSWDNESSQNEKYYMASRTATIVVTEHNFDASRINLSTNGSIGSWATNGDTHTITVTFAEEGTYNLSVDGSDMAGNTLEKYTSPEFVVDLSQPQIAFGILHGTESSLSEQEEPNETAWNDSVINVAMHLSDNNFNGGGITKSEVVGVNTGERFVDAPAYEDGNRTVSFAIKNDVGADDIYNASVEVQDMAGNSNTSSFTFSVNRYGSTWRVTSIDVDSAGEGGNIALNLQNGASITSVVEQLAKQNDGILPGSPAITVEEINVTGAANEDRHVMVTSLEGNTSMGNAVRELRQVTRGTGPGYELNDLGAAESTEMAEEGKIGWNVARYIIHADSFGAADNRALDGRYIVSMSSNDKASLNNEDGNSNSLDKYYSRVLSGNQDASYLKEDSKDNPEVIEGYDIRFTRDSTGPQVLGMSNPGITIDDEAVVNFTLEDDVQAPGGDTVKVNVDTYAIGGTETQTYDLMRADVNGSTTYVDAYTGDEIEGLAFDGDKTFQLKVAKQPFVTRKIEVIATDYAKRESDAQTEVFYVSNLVFESSILVVTIASITTFVVVLRKKKERAETANYE